MNVCIYCDIDSSGPFNSSVYVFACFSKVNVSSNNASSYEKSETSDKTSSSDDPSSEFNTLPLYVLKSDGLSA